MRVISVVQGGGTLVYRITTESAARWLIRTGYPLPDELKHYNTPATYGRESQSRKSDIPLAAPASGNEAATPGGEGEPASPAPTPSGTVATAGPAASGSEAPPPEGEQEEAGSAASGTDPSEGEAQTPEADLAAARTTPSGTGRLRRKTPRGRLDEQAAIELKKNPALSYEQLATILGCKPGTLRDKKKCPTLARARAIIRGQRDTFLGASIWKGRQPDDDES